MKRCKTCKWHQDSIKVWATRERCPEGCTCVCPKICEAWDDEDKDYKTDMLVYSYPEGGTFWTGDNFGCIHHEERT